jgi:hypothetical protein
MILLEIASRARGNREGVGPIIWWGKRWGNSPQLPQCLHIINNLKDYLAERVGFEPTVRDFRLRCARLAPPKMPPHANSVAILKEIDPKAVFSN